jgi:glycosyltransferase involved in cell wall biosynthesis
MGEHSVKSKMKNEIRTWMDQRRISRFVGFYFDADEYYVDGIAEKIVDLNERNSYDIVWMQYFFYFKALEKLESSNVLKVIDTHDRWANRNRMFQKRGETPEGFYTTKRGERKALKRADVVIAIQEKEAIYFKKLLRGTDTKVLTIGDLVEKKTSKPCCGSYYGFIGVNIKCNIIGLRWFYKNVLPLIREKCPDSSLLIAGTVCEKLPDEDGVIKLGRVDELDDFYDSIQFAINPVMSGTGLNIKTIEALAYGRALVSTEIGAKGINSDEPVVVKCSNAREFADAVINLLSNQQECDRLAQNAHRYIEKYNEKNTGALFSFEELCRNKNDF